MDTFQKNNSFGAPRSQSVKKTIINLLGVITLVLAIFVLIASFIPMIGEIAFAKPLEILSNSALEYSLGLIAIPPFPPP